MPTFGRLYAPDARDAAFPLRALVAPPAQLLPYKRWAPGAVLDQGQRGICVGAGWEGWERASPVRLHPLVMEDIYCAAVSVDEWPENDGDCATPPEQGGWQAGTSVRAAAKVLRDKGIIVAWHNSQSAQDVADFICSPDGGPVVIGTNWYYGMESTDAKGFVKLEGGVAGGHCTLLYGANRKMQIVFGQNSWGINFGLKGHFRLTFNQLDQLLVQDGEAVAAVQAAP